MSIPIIPVRLEIPKKLGFFISEKAPYKVAYGGRGGAKSWTIARCLLILAVQKKLRILCGREFQKSIRESVHHLLAEQISILKLDKFFNILQTEIKGVNGSEFIFAGIKHNVASIKSMEGIDICWIEEAHKMSLDSWRVIEPTIRKAGAEIWFSFNPEDETDVVYKTFVGNAPPPGSIVQEIGWRDNPYLDQEVIAKKNYLASIDPDAYMWVWEGGLRKSSDAQILKGKFVVEDFTPTQAWGTPVFGADWGFSVDPTALIKMWIHDETLWIEKEAYGIGVDIDRTPVLFDTISDSKNHVIRADSARPETISYMRRNGYPMIRPCEKWKGSVEDGIAHLRSYKRIVIHPDCKETAQEAALYSYKITPDGEITRDVVDKHNHCIDAIRYGLEQRIKRSHAGVLDFYREQAVKNN